MRRINYLIGGTLGIILGIALIVTTASWSTSGMFTQTLLFCYLAFTANAVHVFSLGIKFPLKAAKVVSVILLAAPLLLLGAAYSDALKDISLGGVSAGDWSWQLPLTTVLIILTVIDTIRLALRVEEPQPRVQAED